MRLNDLHHNSTQHKSGSFSWIKLTWVSLSGCCQSFRDDPRSEISILTFKKWCFLRFWAPHIPDTSSVCTSHDFGRSFRPRCDGLWRHSFFFSGTPLTSPVTQVWESGVRGGWMDGFIDGRIRLGSMHQRGDDGKWWGLFLSGTTSEELRATTSAESLCNPEKILQLFYITQMTTLWKITEVSGRPGLAHKTQLTLTSFNNLMLKLHLAK